MPAFVPLTGWVALAGLALLLLVLGLAVSWRAAVIGLVTVPVAIIAAAYILYLRGNSITTITVLGLAAAVCIVIDDVISDVGAVRRGIAAHRAINGDAGLPLNDAIRSSVAAVRGPLVLATVAIGVATLPFIVKQPVSDARSSSGSADVLQQGWQGFAVYVVGLGAVLFVVTEIIIRLNAAWDLLERLRTAGSRRTK